MPFIIIFILVFSVNSYAQDISEKLKNDSVEKTNAELSDNADFFSSLTGVNKLLQVSGVNIYNINWVEINALCNGVSRISERAQNQCRYEKAMLQATYFANKNFCKNISKRFFAPNQFSNKQIIAIDSNGNKQTLYIAENNVAYFNKKDVKEREYLFCMQQYGWQDINNWHLGKIE